MRILIVEDDPQLARLIKHDLEGAGYVADIVGMVSDGLHAASTITYDALIVDLKLPDGDGMQLVHQLRSTGAAVAGHLLPAPSAQGDKLNGRSGLAAERLGQTVHRQPDNARAH